jgi:hypothetical protein
MARGASEAGAIECYIDDSAIEYVQSKLKWARDPLPFGSLREALRIKTAHATPWGSATVVPAGQCPCDLCPHTAHCRTHQVACQAFAEFVGPQGEFAPKRQKLLLKHPPHSRVPSISVEALV